MKFKQRQFMTEKLKALHACWCHMTGQELHFKATDRLFYEMFKMDFTTDDLLCVLKHVLSYNRTHPNAQMKVQVHKLLGDLEVFASILAEARAKERNRVKPLTPKESALEAWRPTCGERVNGANLHRLSDFLKVPQ